MSKTHLIKRMIDNLKDYILLDDKSILNNELFSFALSIAYLSIKKNQLFVTPADKELFNNSSLEEISCIISKITSGEFEIDEETNSILLEIMNKKVKVPISSLNSYITKEINPKVSRYSTPLLSFYNKKYNSINFFTEDALRNTIFYQINISGKELPVYELESDIERWMAENNNEEEDYIYSYYKAIQIVVERLKENYPGISVTINTINYRDMNKQKDKILKGLKDSYTNYSDFYKDLTAKRKKSMSYLISKCTRSLDSVDKNIIIQIYSLAIMLLNSNFKIVDEESLCKISNYIDGYSTKSYRRFAEHRLAACSSSLDSFITLQLTKPNNGSMKEFPINGNYDSKNLKTHLSVYSVEDPNIQPEVLKKLLEERERCLNLIKEWQTKLYNSNSINDYNIIKKAILTYLEHLSEIEEEYLYFKCNSKEIIELIIEALKKPNSLSIVEDNIAFINVDDSKRIEGFAGCLIESFLMFLSFGLDEDEYIKPNSYK